MCKSTQGVCPRSRTTIPTRTTLLKLEKKKKKKRCAFCGRVIVKCVCRRLLKKYINKPKRRLWVKSMEGDIGTRNTILNHFSDSWTMYWYLFTLKTFWVINFGFLWMCDVTIFLKGTFQCFCFHQKKEITHVSFQTTI